MKTILTLAQLLLWTLAAPAQGTIEFTAYLNGTNAVPPSLIPVDGYGLFSLSNNTFRYEVHTDFLTSWTGAVFGAAAPGQVAPAIFGMRFPLCRAPFPPDDPGECLYRGSVTLAADQFPGLLSGLWYVQVYASYDSSLAMRGQIELVPEPGTVWLLSIPLLPFFAMCRRRQRPCLPLHFPHRHQ